jgi:mRNA interferase YafQ
MLELQRTTAFKRAMKKYKHNREVLEELRIVVELLVNQKPLSKKYLDHELQGKFKGIRELHLKPDDLLLYLSIQNEKVILMGLGSHSELFG